jgi:shikimate kinase
MASHHSTLSKTVSPDGLPEDSPRSPAGSHGEEEACIALIGMPGSGKSTLAQELSRMLGMAWLDTDFLLESWFGVPLEQLKNALSRNEFLRAEERMVLDLWVRRCIIATGGSVIYSPPAIRKLQHIGHVIHLQADVETIISRVSQNPDRGLILNPNQDLRSLYEERTPLYERSADFEVLTGRHSLQDCCQQIKDWMYGSRES